jgi:hypothetical protein
VRNVSVMLETQERPLKMLEVWQLSIVSKGFKAEVWAFEALKTFSLI